MNLRNKILVFVISIIIIPLALLGSLSYNLTKSSAELRATNYLQNEIEQKKVAVENNFQDSISALRLLAESESIAQYIRIDDDTDRYAIALNPLLSTFTNFARAYNDFYEIRLVKINGYEDARFSRSFLTNASEYESESYWFKEAVKSTDNVSLTLDTNRDNDKIALYVTHRLKAQFPSGVLKEDRTWGFLVITINPDVITSVMTGIDPDSTSMLISSTNQVYFRFNDQLAHKTIPHYLLNKLLTSARLNTSYNMNFNNHDMRFRASRLSHDFYLVVGTSETQLYENSRELSYTTLAVTLFMIIFVSGFTYFMITKYLLNPIYKLIKSSEQVASGELSVRLNHRSNDEIGHLFESYNDMIESLESSNKAISHYQEHLEEKVKSRTVALQKANDDLTHSRKEAELANDLKSRFLANMSHEIRTPLTAILGFTEHALHKDIDIEDSRLSMQRVLKNSEHLLSLINDILDLSKIESGKLQLEKVPTSLFSIMADIDTYCGTKAEEKGLLFDINYTYPFPEKFLSDPTRLKQILLNLSSNAIKFTKRGYVSIHLTYYPSAKSIAVEVRDTGIGMTEDEIKNLFNPFVQGDISTTRNYGGTGLGLAISKHLAELLDCVLTVESKKYKGSTFTLKLNNLVQTAKLINQAPKAIVKTQSAANIDLILDDKRVLVAEDNPDNQALIQLLLEPLKIQFTIVENGLLAVEHGIAEEYDLILMDMQMPVMSGIEATKMLRQAGFDEPIIALTANFMPSDIDEYNQVGCTDSLAKPIDSKIFYQTIERHLTDNDEHNSKLKNFEDQLSNSDEYKALVSTFKNGLPNILETLNVAYKCDNYAMLVNEAHKLKGIAASMGYPEVTLVAADIEQLATTKDTEKLKQKMDQLQTAIENMD